MSFPRDTTARASLPVSEENDWAIAAPFRKIMLRLRDRVSIRGLLSLEDEQLDDIGLTRHDVLVALYRCSDPGKYLRQQAKKRKLAALSSRVK